MNKNIKLFLSTALIEMINYKVNINLLRTKQLVMSGDLKCLGYFDLPATFAVAMKSSQKDWFQIFVHEYCHFRQWIDKAPVFIDVDNIHGMSNYDSWLEHKKDLTKKQIIACTRGCQALELDCEKRVVKIIKDYDLPFNIPQYIQKANVYVLFYNYVMKHRKWYTKISPYKSKEVLETVPNMWLKSYKKMTKEYENAITNHVI